VKQGGHENQFLKPIKWLEPIKQKFFSNGSNYQNNTLSKKPKLFQFQYGPIGSPPTEINYVIPHVSSMLFHGKLAEEIETRNIETGTEDGLPTLRKLGTSPLLLFLALLMICTNQDA
jgi:hypothetical protein